MKLNWVSRENLLPLVLGLSDGILTVLTFVADRLSDINASISFGLAMRVSAGVLVSGIFMYFVSHYAELRGQLVHAERQLNLTTRGKLATTHLGRTVIFEAIMACTIASIAAFIGAFIPLLIAFMIPGYPWLPILVALMMLGILGVGLAKALYGSVIRWSVILVMSGLLLWYVGSKLHIV